MNDDNWIFSHLDEFFDDVVDTLEDLEACNIGVDDWNANFEALEPPPFGWTDFPVVPTSNHISCHRPQVKQKPSSTDTSSSRSSYVCNKSNDGKYLLLSQTSSPISVLESGGSCSAEKHVPINPKLVFAVKRARSKRRRPATLNPLFIYPFISSTSEDYHPETASESGSEMNLTEKPVRKKQKRKKNLTVLSGSRENKKLSFQQTDTPRKCMHCEVAETPQWREGPMGPKTLCNACGVRYRSGRLVPEYRPAASPTFVPSLHSNSHKRIMEMRNKGRL